RLRFRRPSGIERAVKTKVAVAIVLAAVAAVVVWELQNKNVPGQVPTPSALGTAAPPAEVDGQKRIGTFAIAGSSYSVVVQEQKRAPGSTQETGTTVVWMEIRNSAEQVEFRKDFATPSDSDAFSDAWSVSANPVKGTQGSGLLINYDLDSEPS